VSAIRFSPLIYRPKEFMDMIKFLREGFIYFVHILSTIILKIEDHPKHA